MITAVQNRSTWSPTRRFRIAAAALVAAASLAIAGCSGTPATDPDGEAPADLTDIVVVSFLPLQSFTFTPEMYAYSSGIFEEHGLDVPLQPVVWVSMVPDAFVPENRPFSTWRPISSPPLFLTT